MSAHAPCCDCSRPLMALATRGLPHRVRCCPGSRPQRVEAMADSVPGASRNAGVSRRMAGACDFNDLACREFQVRKCRKSQARKVCFRGTTGPALDRGVLPSLTRTRLSRPGGCKESRQSERNFWEDRITLACEVLGSNELPRPPNGASSHTLASGRSATRTETV